MRKVLGIAGLTLGILISAGPASATPVTFQGGEFDVTFSDLGGDVYRFVYTADFTGWDDSTNDDFITAIEFGFNGWNDIDSVTLVGDTAPGNWTVVQGNANSNNCDENLSNFKICSEEGALLLSASTEDDQIYTWTIDVAYNTIGDLDVLTGSHPVGAIFYEIKCTTNPTSGEVCEPKQTQPMNQTTTYTSDAEDTPAAPEPTVMALLGAGLMLVSRRLRRRTN